MSAKDTEADEPSGSEQHQSSAAATPRGSPDAVNDNKAAELEQQVKRGKRAAPVTNGGKVGGGFKIRLKGWASSDPVQNPIKSDGESAPPNPSTPPPTPYRQAPATQAPRPYHPSYDDPVHPFGCAQNDCWATFKRYIDLHRHMAAHYGDGSECTCPHVECRKVLVNVHSLLRHLEKQGHFTCPNGGCLGKFQTEREVELHLREFGHG